MATDWAHSIKRRQIEDSPSSTLSTKICINEDLCVCNAVLARLLVVEDPAHLQDARVFANRSGDVELQLRCAHAATELYTHLGDYPQADAGILLADTCGCGKYSLDIRLAHGRIEETRRALKAVHNKLTVCLHLQAVESSAIHVFSGLMCYCPIENPDVPMMFRGTKPRS